MSDQFSPDSASFTAALAAFVVALRQMYAKRLFQIFGVNVRALPLLLMGWTVALLTSAAIGPPEVPVALLIFSGLAIPSILYFWQMGKAYCHFLGIDHPLSFWQIVGIGAPLGYLSASALINFAKWWNTIPPR